MELLEKRYAILRTVYYNQPIGRRVLATKLQLGERIIRTEITFLKEQGLMEINASGMTVTEQGEELIEKLKDVINDIKGISSLEKAVKENLGIKRVIVVPGDSQQDPTLIHEIGKVAAAYLKQVIKDNDILAIAGGTTIKAVVDSLPKTSGYEGIMVVPYRGAMGTKVETQANTLAAVLADKLNGSYRMLHIPDNASQEVMDSLIKEKSIKETVDMIHNANVLICGIGNAEHMARKRGLSEEEILELKALGAVGEAFGCYYNAKGEAVYFTPALGIRLCDAEKIDSQIAVAGGSNKALAILASCKSNKKAVLVTDEAAGKAIIDLINQSSDVINE